MELAAAQVKDTAVFRRLVFAASYLPTDIPHYWNIVATFASQESLCLSPDSAKIVMENVQILSPETVSSDKDLIKQLIGMKYSITAQPLGVPLVPNQTKCLTCGGKLLLRSDRPSRMTLYTDSLGTVSATHFHKYCHNHRKGCKFVQFYGYYKSGNGNAHYSSNWMTLPYFLSSQETGFEMAMLQQFDCELLIGQMSYKQKADIYNVFREYDTSSKTCSTIEQKKGVRTTPVHGYVACVCS